MRQKANVERYRSYDSVECSICLNSVSVVVLSKRALKDLSFIALFSFYLLVKLFTLPELIALVNKDLHNGRRFTSFTPSKDPLYDILSVRIV